MDLLTSASPSSLATGRRASDAYGCERNWDAQTDDHIGSLDTRDCHVDNVGPGVDERLAAPGAPGTVDKERGRGS